MHTTSRKRQIRFLLDETAHDQIRVAAAIRRTSMADFCRETMIREAAVVTGGTSLSPSTEAGLETRSRKE